MNKDHNFREDDDLDPEESLKLDNQIKRLELELAGAKFIEHNPEGIELPAEIEAQMLDQILSFEKMKKQAKEVSLFEYLNKPKIKPLEDLSAEEIKIEKERLFRIFKKKGITVGSILPVDDKEMYRFISTELIKVPTLDMPMKGFMRHFIYEEFHPSIELHVMQVAYSFFHAFFHDMDPKQWEESVDVELKDYLAKFSLCYSRFENFEAVIEHKDLKKRTAKLHFHASWNAFLENSLKSHLYEGSLTLKLKTRAKNWYITEIQMPKLKGR